MKTLLKLTKYFFLIFLILFIVTFFSIYLYSRKLDYSIPKNINIELYDANNNLITTTSTQKNRSHINIDTTNQYIIDAFISIEDKEFYNHQGVNIKRVIGALIADIKSKEFSQGGSTITQQYVKNIFLTNDKTIKRKFDEALIAINIERKYTKKDILEGYLNTIYFDHGIYGIEDAANFYFNKSSKELTLGEACTLAAIPKSPNHYSPIKNFENNKNRKNLILKEMLKDNKISKEEYTKAINEEIEIYGKHNYLDLNSAPYYIDSVLKELKELNIKYDDNIKIYTNYDKSLNNIIVNAINKYYPKNDDLQIAIYAVDNNGSVISTIGGKSYIESTYNRTESLRQPGSTVKPFLYYAALNNGFNVSHRFKSTKTTFNIDGKEYSPKNYNDKYAEQDISMIYAIAVSDNIYALKTHLFLGTNILQETLKDFGIKSKINNNVSLALGTSETTLNELTNAYSKFATLGKNVNNKFINKIIDSSGNTLYEQHKDFKQTYDKSTCYILSEALTNIFDTNIRINTSPTGASISAKLRDKYAAKTGSTDFDNWIIGYNNNITLGIWTGYDDNRIIKNDNTRFIKYIWADIMEEYNKNKNNNWYQTPNDCIGIKLNPINGMIANDNEYSKYLYYKKDNLPF